MRGKKRATPKRASSRASRDSQVVTSSSPPTNLKELQYLTARAVMRPLTGESTMQRTWTDGRPTADVMAGLIKPNDRLTSIERIEIYNRQYWFRLVDIMHEDYPGLRAVLGNEAFESTIRAYIDAHPNTSYTLRNLGQHMAAFLAAHPEHTNGRQKMAADMAAFERAQTIAFDEAELPPIAPDDLVNRDPATLQLRLQPYITLLALSYPLDKFSQIVRRQMLRSEASNASEKRAKRKEKPFTLPRKSPVCLAVHRLKFEVYYKRLDPAAYKLLSLLHMGLTLGQACDQVLPTAHPEVAELVGNWFREWMSMGWFCQTNQMERETRKKARRR